VTQSQTVPVEFVAPAANRNKHIYQQNAILHAAHTYTILCPLSW